MKVKFAWKDSYSVGRSDVDEQHKQLFSLANALPDELDVQTWHRIIMELYKYTRIHFSAEEQMMRELGYSKHAEHSALHEGLISQLAQISAQAEPSARSTSEFKMFFYSWIIDHILTQDMDYASYIQQKHA